MKVYKALFRVTLFGGLSIFLVGAYLEIYNQTAFGLTAGRFGNVNQYRITGSTGMFLGALFILLSIWTYRIYKEEKEKFDKME